MTDDDLIKRFIRIVPADTETHIQFCHISWKTPYLPVSHWKPVRSLPASATEDEIAAEIRAILHDPQFFQVCVDCKQRNPVGWMMGDMDHIGICHSCAQQNHGVLF